MKFKYIRNLHNKGSINMCNVKHGSKSTNECCVKVHL